MTFTYTQPKTDWNCLDNLETVSLTPQSPVSAPVTGIKATRQPLSLAELEWSNSAGLGTDTTRITLFGSTISTGKPNRKDLITDAAGAVWIVQKIDYSYRTGSWHCVCNLQD